jgi:hypothetical protein
MPSDQDAAIAAFLQSELRRRRLDEVPAVTAAEWLAHEGLLVDSAQRPGLPLRKRLREGQIEGAVQRPAAPHGRWFIVRLDGPGRPHPTADDDSEERDRSATNEQDASAGIDSETTETSVTGEGDPDEFDEALEGEIVEGDEGEKLQVPPGLLRQLFAEPAHAPELLAMRAVEQFAKRAERDVRILRERNPGVPDRKLAIYFKQKYSRAARWEGAGTGAAGIFGVPADLALLAWIQSRLVLTIAAAYGHDMTDHKERAAELLVIQGIHAGVEVARRKLEGAAMKTATRLILRHLRKQALTLVKQLSRVVGITFTRKALLEKGVPLLSIPISAGVNYVSTRLLANRAIKFYDTEVR